MRGEGLLLPLLALALLAGCASKQAGPPGQATPQQVALSGEPMAPPAERVGMLSYGAIITDRDRYRLRDWRPTLLRALADARATDAATVQAGGVLFQPDSALDRPMPPAGEYDCSVSKLGSGHPGLLHFIAYPAFRCSVTSYPDGTAALVKRTGSQRPVGTLYPGDALHAVFLGTLQLSDERAVIPYGRDVDRDLVARVERIGRARWRMIFPAPVYESITDIVELTPVG